MAAYTEEDVGNIILFEHVNVQIPDQLLATLFYVIGLGLTRDPYMNVGLNNMWVNVGEQQFHLPTRKAQVIPGHVGLVLPDLDGLEQKLAGVEAGLKGSRFAWARKEDHIAVTCPWGNNFRCYRAGQFGDMALGIPYVEFLVAPGAAKAITGFYREVFGAPSAVEPATNGAIGRVMIGRNQSLVFRESRESLTPYDGHHIAIYVGQFSRPFHWLNERQLITEEVRNHQFRFKDIVDPDQGSAVFALEHEVRSLHHPMFHRPFVNRDAGQTQAGYKPGRDAFVTLRG